MCKAGGAIDGPIEGLEYFALSYLLDLVPQGSIIKDVMIRQSQDMGESEKYQHCDTKVGDEAPDFSLPSDSGANVSLKDFKGHTLVLYFFPKADTPG